MTFSRPEVFLVVAPGLESLLIDECRAIGLPVAGTEAGGVTLDPGADWYRANLELRIASKVLLRVAEFEARHFSELMRYARQLPWDRFVPAGSAVTFRVTSKKSRLFHQDAIAERLTEAVARSVNVRAQDQVPPEEGQEFVVRVFRDRVSISVDTSGDLLHRRGYRLAGAKAPLRETLAAAMIRASGWDGRGPLIDPVTGSGTIPIEAALIARGIAPGLRRAFAFQRFPCFDSTVWKSVVAAAEAKVAPRAPGPILGADRDAGAIEMARANAARAGVVEDLSFQVRSISDTGELSGPAWLVANPPYGARVGDPRSLRNLYARLGTIRRARLAAGTATILVADAALERSLEMPTSLRFTTRNGGIQVRCVSF